MKEEKVLELLQRAMNLTLEEAKVAIKEAKKRIEAGAVMGVAGFWS